ncbi:MAG TPA: hypothetical protein VEI03_08970 [Stellaceae bacterium]|nr:hypothetical protein [Stellaceae bacterium]
MVYLVGYIISIIATAGIVAGIEALNRCWSHGAGWRPRPVAIPVARRQPHRQPRLRQDRP